eukprot:CAMPEP_0197839332 /NCGR_PEP_ID=MMETSP1437-20131217/42209_1 /TAXON_ID=49252 ORGANISM="Eucampia antarctica, Strain CCMP1452" /NCGR_SAMPLE_ID=MMETSP1437 /ASSEMBLY_ACC=CAM_ASM_001096 /LENGTH=117 /DNA_ID=CAMNT_0043448269 /DNA_START=35 /DNA_END=388 /DNA_ORIENTATION=+
MSLANNKVLNPPKSVDIATASWLWNSFFLSADTHTDVSNHSISNKVSLNLAQNEIGEIQTDKTIREDSPPKVTEHNIIMKNDSMELSEISNTTNWMSEIRSKGTCCVDLLQYCQLET